MKFKLFFIHTRIPDEKQLMSVTEKLASELEEQSKQLDELRENVPYTSVLLASSPGSSCSKLNQANPGLTLLECNNYY